MAFLTGVMIFAFLSFISRIVMALIQRQKVMKFFFQFFSSIAKYVANM